MYTCTYILYVYSTIWASLVTQLVKNPPALQETWVWSLGWEDPLQEGMASHSSILVWRTPWTEEPGGLQFMGSQESDTTERLSTAQHYICRYSSVVKSCLALLWSMKPAGLLCPWVLQTRTLGWVAISFSRDYIHTHIHINVVLYITVLKYILYILL